MKTCAHITRVHGLVKTYSLTLLCVMSYNGFAQDIHFTQFFTNPLSINAAQTGLYDGNYRIGLNAKMQWAWALRQGAFNYHTETPYVDFSFGEDKLKVGWFGVGMNFVNDVAGDGKLTYRRGGATFAYHQTFDKKHRYVLSAGAGLHYIIRTVDFSKFYFNNQWIDDEGFSISIPNGEPLQTQNFSMVDVHAGLQFTAHVINELKLEAGFAMLHLNRPRHSFLGSTERLGLRYQANMGATYFINQRLSVAVQAYYTNQKKASETIVGTQFSYGFYANRSLDHRIYAGLYHRVKDMVAPLLGYSYRNTRILINYDINISKLILASRSDGGLEISFVHIGAWGKNRYRGKKTYCPSFKR